MHSEAVGRSYKNWGRPLEGFELMFFIMTFDLQRIHNRPLTFQLIFLKMQALTN
jgi:hypothetical protein